MADTHVLTALIDKYRRVAGELQDLGRNAQALRNDLTHLDAAIRLFKADVDSSKLEPIRPYLPNVVFRHGELARLAYDVLREAGGSLTTRDILMRIFEIKGMAEPEARVFRQLRNTLNGCLVRREKAGTVIGDEAGGQRVWRVVG